MARLVISCPNCGAPNAATVAACVQCGANLKPEAPIEQTLPNRVGSSASQSNAASAQSSGQVEAAPVPQRNARVQTPRNLVSHKQAEGKGGIANLGLEAVFYVGCAILILVPILVIGLGPLRIMFARIFQH